MKCLDTVTYVPRICTQNFNYDVPSVTLIHNIGWLNVIQRKEYLTGLLVFSLVMHKLSIRFVS